MDDAKRNIFEEDFDTIINNNQWHLKQIRRKSFFITGATGLIGRNITEYLLYLNRQYSAGIKIFILVRDLEKTKMIFGKDVCTKELTCIIADVKTNLAVEILEDSVDYIIHAASETSSRKFIEEPVETILTAIEGTANILSFAREIKVKSMVYLSSMEVYGISTDSNLIKENDIGYLDPLEVRSSYSESKKMAENLCISFASEYDVPVKIIRLAQTFGPGVKYDDGRVFAQFARCAIEQKAIKLQTMGKTKRTYLYTADAVSAILTVLIKGENKNAYNAANMETYCSIKEMADLVANKVANNQIDVVIDLPDIPNPMYNPLQKLFLDSSKLQKLGWEAVTDLETMYRRMIEAM